MTGVLTPILRLEKPNYASSGWDVATNNNWDLIDGAFSQFVNNANVRGVWANSTLYYVNNVATDPSTFVTYVCLIQHTSAITPTTFAADRAANPTYWILLDTASAYANTARTAASAASTSASSAATQATNAFTFATAASTSATDASNQAVSAAASAVLAAAYTNSPMMNRNKIINGSMLVWQSGTSFAIDGYCADMWIGQNITGVNRSTDVPIGFTYSMSVAGNTTPTIKHRIESRIAATMANSTCIFSIWQKNSVGTTALEAVINIPTVVDNFGAVTQVGSTQSFAAPTGSWTRTQFALSIPSTASRGLEILWRRAAGVTTTLYAGAQAEVSVSGVATLNEYLWPHTEVLACQHHYQRFNYTYKQNMAAGENALDTVYFHPMRTTATAAILAAGTQVNVAAFATAGVVGDSLALSITATAAAATSVTNATITLDARL